MRVPQPPRPASSCVAKARPFRPSAEKAAPLHKSASSKSLNSGDPEASTERQPRSPLSQAKQRASKAVGPALGALAAAQIVLVPGVFEGQQSQHDPMVSFAPAITMRAARVRGNPIAQIAAEASGSQHSQPDRRSSNGSQQASAASEHRRPLDSNPLSKVPFVGNRAPDFPPSRSRLTLAERAAAAAS